MPNTYDDSYSDRGLTRDQKIVREAYRRHKRCQEVESTCRSRSIEDVKFGNGDSENGYQWSENVAQSRSGLNNDRPCLTVNKTRQHCLQIVNDARQNKPSIDIRPTGGGATYKSAEIFEGIVRHIEYISNAQDAYEKANWDQVFGGIGWWRIVTDYIEGSVDEQEIYIRRIKDALSVYLDPDINEADGSDAKFGFVFRDMPREEFDEEYPRYKDKVGELGTVLDHGGDWCDKDHVKVAEYFRIVTSYERLIKLDTGETLRDSEVPPEVLAQLEGRIRKERQEAVRSCEWYLIAGDQIVERRPWPGKYIPLVRVVGEEHVFNGQLDRWGHVRALKDPQRIYNYWSSAAVEFVALQGNAPWVLAAESIESNQQDWENANVNAPSVLIYKAYDENGRVLPKPERPTPPVMPQAYIQGMQVAQQELMLASGQYQAIMGQPSNETSGKAINARQRQGDNATYHYINRTAQAIRYSGRIIIDLVPKVYDNERIIRIMGEDNKQTEVQVNPQLGAAEVEQKDPQTGDVIRIFDPNVGRYEVEADIGPNYATRRQEAFNAFQQIVAQNNALVPVIGDLMFEAADFPMADKIAERLRRMVPPQALGDQEQSPMVMQVKAQAQQQMQQLHGIAGQMADELAKTKGQLKQLQSDMDIKQYDAETRRLSAVGGIDRDALVPVIREMVSQMLGMPIGPIMDAHAVADARRGPDGGVGNMPPVEEPGGLNGAASE